MSDHVIESDRRATQECDPHNTQSLRGSPRVVADPGTFSLSPSLPDCGLEKLIPSPSPLKLEQDVVTSHQHRIAVTKQRREADKAQGRLLDDQDLWHDTIGRKLAGLFDSNQFVNFQRCGQEKIFRVCRACRDVETFTYQCSIKWCPRCNWRITKRRQHILAKWIARIDQPKHLVTTQRNFSVLTNRKLKEHSQALAKLRRSMCFEKVRGGCVSMEVTNESRGWHLHAHWLVDARWVDAQALAVTWGNLVGQEFAVCCVKDLRDRKQYQKEIAKYVVKGSEMAKWPAEEIHQFVRAVKGRRFFFQFGSLFKEAAAIRRELAAEKPERAPCECGCSEFMFEDERQALIRELRANR